MTLLGVYQVHTVSKTKKRIKIKNKKNKLDHAQTAINTPRLQEDLDGKATDFTWILAAVLALGNLPRWLVLTT